MNDYERRIEEKSNAIKLHHESEWRLSFLRTHECLVERRFEIG